MSERVWSWPLAIYLFLGGLGAGMTIVATIADVCFGQGELFALAPLVAACCLALGAACLLFELGVTLAFWRVFTWHGAVLNFGAYSLGILIALDAVYFSFFTGWFPWCASAEGRMVVAALSLVAAVCVIVYTGVELSSMRGRSFWNTPALPILFTVSGLLTGVAADSLLAGAWPYAGLAEAVESVQLALSYVGILLALLTLLSVVAYVLMMKTSSDAFAQKSATRWISGSFAVPFWLVQIVIGLAVPIALYAFGGPVPVLFANCCVLAGGMCLRALFVFSNDRRMLPGEEDYYEMLATGDEPFMKTNWT